MNNRFKKYAVLFLCIVVFSIGLGPPAFANGKDVTVKLNGEFFFFPDAKPFIDENNRTLVPLRAVSETLGYDVFWHGNEEKEVSITKDDLTIHLAIGDPTLKQNGEMVSMDTVPIILENRTYVPIRFIVDRLGSAIEWDQQTKTANIVEPSVVIETPEKTRFGNVEVNEGRLNVRVSPSLQSAVLDTVEKGDSLLILAEEGDWFRIQHNNQEGFVHADFVAPSFENRKVIVLDPGHGGKDPGARGVDGVTNEHVVNFSFADRAKTALEEKGYHVVMTRDSGKSCLPVYNQKYEELDCRVQLADKVEADIFISIHSNWFYNNAAGTETYYNANDLYDGNINPYPNESRRLAELIHEHTIRALDTNKRWLADKNYYVNRMANVPSVLVELAYMSNWNDLWILQSEVRKDRFAEELAKAVQAYFDENVRL